jgi:hypothetical protein
MSTIKMIAGLTAALVTMTAAAQYDSQTLVDTNNTSTSTSTVTSTNTNTNNNNNINDTTVNSTATNTNTNINTSTSTNTNNNNNVNTTTSTNTNNNNNVNTSTSTNVNTNNNINSGEQTFNNNNVNTSTINSTNRNENVNTTTSTNVNTNTSENVNRNINSGEQTFNNNNTVNSTSDNTTRSTSDNRNENVNRNENTTRVEQPPPTAIAPSMMSGGNNDLCTTGTSGAVQTQIMGVSSGGTVRDKNCERLKNAKTLYDMGMKVAAVSVMCQDRRVFDAMWNAGTPCPFEGMIGAQARAAWEQNPDRIPAPEPEDTDDFYAKASFGALLGWLLFIL